MLCLSAGSPCPAAGGRLGSSSKLGEMPLPFLAGRRAAPCLEHVGGVAQVSPGSAHHKGCCIMPGAGGCGGNVPSASSQHTSQGSDHTLFGVDKVVSTPAPEAVLSLLPPRRAKCSCFPPSQVCFPPVRPCWARQCSSQSCSVSLAWGMRRCSTWDRAQTHQYSRTSTSIRCEVILKAHSRQ